MPRFFTSDVAAFYENYHKHEGINIIKGKVAIGFNSDTKGELNILLSLSLRVICQTTCHVIQRAG